jgi:hypothetical protein
MRIAPITGENKPTAGPLRCRGQPQQMPSWRDSYPFESDPAFVPDLRTTGACD